jgi:uncharacterized protein (DUF362 family)
LSEVYYASSEPTVRDSVERLLEALDFNSLLPAGQDVLLKVNLTWDFLRPGVVTSPWVVDAAARVLQRHCGAVHLGESSQILVDATNALAETRMADVAKRRGLVWHDFSKEAWDRREINGLSFSIPHVCTQMPVISLPVVKTHYRSVLSIALKNLYGCLDDNRHNYHFRLTDYTIAVNKAIPVVLTLADGTVSLEGGGPKPGKPKRTDFLAASTDRVALDCSLAKVMGFDPRSVPMLRSANGILGKADDVRERCLPPMDGVPRFDFDPAVPNFVARIEALLRGRRTEPKTDGPLMGIMTFGARLWYRIGYRLLGQRAEAERWIADPKYGPQWRGLPEEGAE